ncbi:MAG: nitroreductase family deazaflavin-dependent oxidoreductase [Ktedonobacteraceae bacterium]
MPVIIYRALLAQTKQRASLSTQQSLGETIMDQKDYNRQLIEEFRANRGKSDGPFAGRPMLLLTTTGARSGQSRTTPMMHVHVGNLLLVIASNVGAPTHPDWYRNLVAHPEVTVEVGNETYTATAIVTEGAEREQLWNSIIEKYPFFTDHQAKTTRQIPVIALERREG